jgi:hypothetical protein
MCLTTALCTIPCYLQNVIWLFPLRLHNVWRVGIARRETGAYRNNTIAGRAEYRIQPWSAHANSSANVKSIKLAVVTRCWFDAGRFNRGECRDVCVVLRFVRKVLLAQLLSPVSPRGKIGLSYAPIKCRQVEGFSHRLYEI